MPAGRFANALRAAGEDPDAVALLRKAKGKAAAAKRAATIRKKRAQTTPAKRPAQRPARQP